MIDVTKLRKNKESFMQRDNFIEKARKLQWIIV